MESKQKLLIDVDTGIDDALALILLSTKINNTEVSITTSGGNCTVDDTTRNTLAVASMLSLNAKIYKGSNKPIMLKNYKNAYDFHGDNGLANIRLPVSKKVESQDACDFIVDFLKQDESLKTIIWLSATTNLALALKKDASIAKYIDRLILMGGTIDKSGNETEFAEFNFYQDPHATKIVFDNLAEKIVLIPLDVTDQCPLLAKDLDDIADSEIGNFVKKLVANWYDYFGSSRKRDFYLYDPLAASVILRPFLKFKTEKFDFFVEGKEQGALMRGSQYQINYAYSVDSKSFIKFFISTINDIK